MNRESRHDSPQQDVSSLKRFAWFSLPRSKTRGDRRKRDECVFLELLSMEVSVHLKVCEGCGCLWFRAQHQASVYCKNCEVKLAEFPSPETRKKRGRRGRRAPGRAWPLAEAGGAA